MYNFHQLLELSWPRSYDCLIYIYIFNKCPSLHHHSWEFNSRTWWSGLDTRKVWRYQRV